MKIRKTPGVDDQKFQKVGGEAVGDNGGCGRRHRPSHHQGPRSSLPPSTPHKGRSQGL